MDNNEEVNIKHLLCIANGTFNPAYENDPSFDSLWNFIKKLSGGSRLGSNLNGALIFGLYPKLKEPCEEFNKRSNIIAMSKLDNGAVSKKLDEAMDMVINKYNLPLFIKMSSPEEIKNNTCVQKTLKDTILKDIREDCSPVVAELATKYADKVDFMELGKSFAAFSRASWILTGKIAEKRAVNYTDVDGVSLGLKLLQLKKDGIITKNKIIDEQKVNQALKHVKINGNFFDLSTNIATCPPTTRERPLMVRDTKALQS